MASAKVNKYGITDQQQAFADEYIINPVNQAQAAIKAGYTAKSAYSVASRLLKNVKVQNYLKQRKDELEEDKIADQKEILQFWTKGMRGERKEVSVVSGVDGIEQVESDLTEKDKIKNAELLAKATGMFIDRQEITNTQPIIIGALPDDGDENIEVNDDADNNYSDS